MEQEDGAEHAAAQDAVAPPHKKRARRERPATSPSSSSDKEKKKAGQEDDDVDEAAEWAAFERVKKNRAACLQFLVGLTQRIERMWVRADQLAEAQAHADNDATAASARQRVVGRVMLLRRCLEALEDHKDPDLREVARLAQKIKESSIPHLSLKHFLGLFLPIERKFTRGLADHEFLIQRQDDVRTPAAQKIPLVLVLDNLRSAFNVGAIFRTAECFGVRKIFLCGYTATPDEEKTLRTTMNAHQFVPWEWHQRTSDVMDMLASGRYSLDEAAPASADGVSAAANPPLPVVALETVEGQPSIYAYTFPSRSAGGCALLLGNERHGIEADLLKRCAAIVSIPCVGVKNSLNVGVAFGICLYEISRQWHLELQVQPHPAPTDVPTTGAPAPAPEQQ